MKIQDVLKRNADKYRNALKAHLFDFPNYFRLALPEIAHCRGPYPTLEDAEKLVSSWFADAILETYPTYQLSDGMRTQLAQELCAATQECVGAKITRLRLDCGWTQSQLAEELEFDDDRTVRRHENGEGMYPDTRQKYKATFERQLGRPIDL
jgi:hypothetical protein